MVLVVLARALLVVPAQGITLARLKALLRPQEGERVRPFHANCCLANKVVPCTLCSLQ